LGVNATALLGAEPEADEYGLVRFGRQDAEFVLSVLHDAGSLREFVDQIYESQTGIGERAREIHEKVRRLKDEMLDQLVKGTQVTVSPSGVRFAVLHENPAGLIRELFARLEVDILIHPNERTPGALSVVRDSDGRFSDVHVAELVVFQDDQLAFRHPGGFLLVAYPPVLVK